MPSFTTPQRYLLAREAGFGQEDAITATAISLAEDPSGDPAALSPANTDGSHDLGLMQINSQHWSLFGGPAALSDALTNMSAAFQLWKNRSSTFNDWTTFVTGAFRVHLGEARTAAQQVESGTFDPATPPTIGQLPTPGAAPGLAAGAPLAQLAQNVGTQLGTITQQASAIAANPAKNNLNQAVGQAAGALGGLAGGVGGFLQLLSGILGHLVDTRFWWRIALVVLGGAAVLIGLVLYVKPPIGELVRGAAAAAA